MRAVPTLADLPAAARPRDRGDAAADRADRRSRRRREAGCAAAVIITTGLGHGPGSIAEATAKAARAKGAAPGRAELHRR